MESRPNYRPFYNTVKKLFHSCGKTYYDVCRTVFSTAVENGDMKSDNWSNFYRSMRGYRQRDKDPSMSSYKRKADDDETIVEKPTPEVSDRPQKKRRIVIINSPPPQPKSNTNPPAPKKIKYCFHARATKMNRIRIRVTSHSIKFSTVCKTDNVLLKLILKEYLNPQRFLNLVDNDPTCIICKHEKLHKDDVITASVTMFEDNTVVAHVSKIDELGLKVKGPVKNIENLLDILTKASNPFLNQAI